jgi:rare lipoprotein A (peptidoglycan hydrolase)
MLLLSAALAISACEKKATKAAAEVVDEKAGETPKAEPSPSPQEGKKDSREGYAVWYDVPDGSLAQRRAEKGQMTAAHNRLPLGTMVRVTHLAHGKSVIVRITDRGIITRASIDLCKEAAEELGMIREGRARVRMEVLPDDKGVTAVPDSTGTAAHP